MAKKKTAANDQWTTGENPAPVGGADLHREPHRKPYTRKVAVDANLEEQVAVAHDLSDLLTRELAVKAMRREKMAGFREELSGIDDRKKELIECVRSNRKLVDVRVQEFIRSDNVIEVCRVDSGECIDRRTAESEDLQRSIEDGATDV